MALIATGRKETKADLRQVIAAGNGYFLSGRKGLQKDLKVWPEAEGWPVEYLS